MTGAPAVSVVVQGRRAPEHVLLGTLVDDTVLLARFGDLHLGPAAVEALGEGLLVDLRSGTYAAFWRPDEVAARTATVRVLHEVQGVRKVVSHFNKATKGRIVRALMESGAAPRTPARLADALRDLGWAVEVGAPGKKGTQLDVVVTEL